ncbi:MULTISPECIES: rhodanese-like domain-containing protein [Mucilaginibacter]|uniref:rhodanese-like domain-containing protein n=1 Tax=Mucilaginibacter TaxID=423349 RepID=UPI00159D94DC|nr:MULTISPECIES: rhodanese-like domain-containing protein [Mucilaginibacter]NVM65301.1 membrane protein DedA with SNARE-associated domain/rhodanese-related sulfurtransferase [Mucilaginibacter sp. SG538B]GGA98992.1 membrane protein [Mucilaginibacter rubeus]
MNALVDLIQTYGLWLVFLITLLQSVGLPLPAFAVLIVTTAVTPATEANIIILILTGSLGTLAGDLILYFAGKRYGTGILGKLCKISMSPDTCVRSTGDIFERYGAPALTIVKFIPGLSTLAPVVAGVYAMRVTLFVFFSSIAALIYLGAAVTLGAVFRHQVDGLIAALSHYGTMGGLFVVVLFGLYLLFKWLRRYRLIRQFETDRLTVNDLIELIDGESNPVILDARPIDQRTRNGFIPGSVPIDENSFNDIADRYAGHKEIVIYCSCPNEITAARYAEKLRKVGLKRIRPLVGGIDAWAQSGQQVTFL